MITIAYRMLSNGKCPACRDRRQECQCIRIAPERVGELGAEGGKVKTCDLLVESLGEDVHLATCVLASVLLLPELELGKNLVGEGRQT